MNSSDINRILDLAQAKQNLMEDFLQLTEGQAEAINNSNYAAVLHTIKQKQNLIEQINRINLSLPTETPGDNETLRLLNARTRELVVKARTIDDENREMLQKRQAQILEKLKLTRQKRATHTLYRGKNIKMEGILLDQKK